VSTNDNTAKRVMCFHTISQDCDCHAPVVPDHSHGQGRTGRVSKQNDSAVDLKQALNTIRLALEKLGDEPTQIAWAQFKRLHMELRADLGLVERTVEGVARRLR
jgi:hypothetical protein